MFFHESDYIQLVRRNGDEVTERGLYKVTDGEIKKLCDLDTFWTLIRADGVVAVNDNMFIISNGEKKYFVTAAGEKTENPPAEAVIVDYSDETTGIGASAEKGVVEDGAKLTVEAVADKTNENTFTYNICFKKGEEEVQPNGKVTVKIPVPEAIKDKTIYVYRVEEDGKYTDMNAKVEDGFVVFETDHFSEYLVTSEKHEKSDNSPNTGYAGISLALIALAGASVVAFRKKNS